MMLSGTAIALGFPLCWFPSQEALSHVGDRGSTSKTPGSPQLTVLLGKGLSFLTQ